MGRYEKAARIDFSEVMKDAIREKLIALNTLKEFANKSRLSEEEIEKISIELGRIVKGKIK